MKTENINKAMKVLNLRRNIIGVKLVDFKEAFDALEIPIALKRAPLCYLLREAMDGAVFKATGTTVSCEYARYATGLSKPDSTISEGCSYHYCGLYESKSVAKEIVSSMKYLSHEIHGVVIGPLQLMEDADIVIIADYSETIMRVMQGYAYKFGSPGNLNFFGNQAACADLIAKPFANNDINVSLMCRGMRARGRFEQGEIAASVPIGMFDSLVEGIVATINPVSCVKEKKRIMIELDHDELGTEINLDYNYGVGLKAYDKRVKDLRKKAK